MPAASELRTVAGRTGALALLRHHARVSGCDLSVVDETGAPVPTGADDSGAGSGRGASRAAVRVFDRVVGWVVTAPRNGADLNGVPADVAARGAALLADLCTREYELNDLSREILGAYEELNLFYQLSAEFAGAPDPESIAAVAAHKAAEVLSAERAWVLLTDASGRLRPAAAHDAPGGPSDPDPAAGAAGRVLASRVADVVEDAAALAPGSLAGWELSARHGLLTVPVCVPGRPDRPVLGVLQVVGRADAGAFTAGDLKLAGALASHAAVLLENQRLIAVERELRIARTIQESLLPHAPPRVAGLDVAGRCIAASSVGGDFWDHVVLPDGTLVLVVADVSGHDLAAALVQTAARSTLRAHALGGRGPAHTLAGANRTLHDDLTRAEMFLTAWVACVDGRTGALRFADAGHPPALLFRAATGRVEHISRGGPPVGVSDDAAYAEDTTSLAAGDTILAFTDGLLEARAPDGSEFGEEGLARSLRAHADRPADEIADLVLADVLRHSGAAAEDDRTVVVVKMREPDSR